MPYSTTATASSKKTQITITDAQVPDVKQDLLDFAPFAQDFLDFYQSVKKKPPIQLQVQQIEQFLPYSIFAKFYNDLNILTKQKPPQMIDYELYLRIMNAVLHEFAAAPPAYDVVQQIQNVVAPEVFQLFKLIFYFAAATQDNYSSTTKLGAVMANFWQVDYKKVLKCKQPLCITGDCIDFEMGMQWLLMVWQTLGSSD